MHRPSRRIPSLVATVVAVMWLAACGSGDSGETVAKVAGVGSITKATLDHWIPIEAVTLYQDEPKQPVPKGVIPDPPDYTACIAYLKATPQKLGETVATLTASQVKGKCRQRYQELKVLTLNLLIEWHWTIGAGLALGAKVSDAEAQQRLEKLSKSHTYPTKADFDRYLRLTGQSRTDMLFRARVQLFEEKLLQERTAIEKRLPSGLTAEQQQSAIAQAMKDIPPSKGWAAKTSCSKGYVVSACRQYRGPLAPGTPD